MVRAYRALLDGGVPGEVYNVCRGQAVSIQEVAARLVALAGVDLEIVVDPARVRPADLPELRGDGARISAATGWKPVIPLDDTFVAILDYWRQSQAPPSAG